MSDLIYQETKDAVERMLKLREGIVTRIQLLKDAKIPTVSAENELAALDLKIADWRNALAKRGINIGK